MPRGVKGSGKAAAAAAGNGAATAQAPRKSPRLDARKVLRRLDRDQIRRQIAMMEADIEALKILDRGLAAMQRAAGEAGGIEESLIGRVQSALEAGGGAMAISDLSERTRIPLANLKRFISDHGDLLSYDEASDLVMVGKAA